MFVRVGSLGALMLVALAVSGCPGGMTATDSGPGLDGGGGDSGGGADGGNGDDTGGDDTGSDDDGGSTDTGGSIDAGGDDVGTNPDADMRDAGTSRTCGGIVGGLCGRSEYCDIVDGARFCGAAGLCRPRPTACDDVLDPVCGCDGEDYANPCEANAAGTDYVEAGTCGGTSDCDPDQAVGEGGCDLFHGWAWNGAECVGVSGCSCRGADCDALPDDMDVCVREHAGCSSTDGTFACGPDMACVTGIEYCEEFSGGAIGAVRYSCNDLPRGDRCRSAPSCDTCFPDPSPGGGCREEGPGEITVSIAAP